MSIQAAPSHNNTAGLQALDPEPAYSGRLFAETVYTPQRVYRNGEYVILAYPILEASDAVVLLARFGLTAAESAEATIRLPLDDLTTFANYNGTAERLRRESIDGTCYRDFDFLIRDIEAI